MLAVISHNFEFVYFINLNYCVCRLIVALVYRLLSIGHRHKSTVAEIKYCGKGNQNMVVDLFEFLKPHAYENN